MKKKIIFILSFVFIFAISIFGCGAISLSGGPNLKDTVYGNGGNAVVKGNYLYFSNAFVDYEKISQGQNEYNENNSLKIYGIYRTKIGSNGVVALDEDGNPEGAELLVPLASGFKNSSLYICGKYLYYTTVYTEYESGGNSSATTGFLNFERVDLNGENRMTLTNKGDFKIDCEYSVNYVNGTVYISILSGNKITVIKSKNGDTNKYQIASSVEDMCVAKQSKLAYGDSEKDVNKYVYYTKNNNNEYSLYRKSLNGGEEDVLIPVSNEEIKLEQVKNGRVYYTQGSVLKSSAFEENETPKSYTAISSESETGNVDFAILDDTYGFGLDRGVATVYNSGSQYYITIVNNNSDDKIILSSANQINILFTESNKIYYQLSEDEKLYSIDFVTGNKETVITSFSSESAFDYDEERVFFFATVKNSNEKLKYLQIALLSDNVYTNDLGESVAQYIGVLDRSDIKTETENED